MDDKINKEEIKKYVEIFYYPPFKTFYINSADGIEFTRPTGVFVSLGITSSIGILEKIRNILNNSKGYSAKLVEIMSEKVDGMFINSITKEEGPDEICQYEMEDDPEDCLKESKARDLLNVYEETIKRSDESQNLTELVIIRNKLKEIIEKLDNSPNGWEDHMIQVVHEDSETKFRVFHKRVNYRKLDDIEYRIGIYVTKS